MKFAQFNMTALIYNPQTHMPTSCNTRIKHYIHIYLDVDVCLNVNFFLKCVCV